MLVTTVLYVFKLHAQCLCSPNSERTVTNCIVMLCRSLGPPRTAASLSYSILHHPVTDILISGFLLPVLTR